MKVRPIRADDAQALLALRCALWPDRELDRHREVLRLRAESAARHETFVAEDAGGAVCGFLDITREPGVPGEAPRVSVDALFVAPPARRKGLARQLMLSGERWAHRRGAAVLYCALDADRPELLQAMQWLEFGTPMRRVHLHRTVSAPLEVQREPAPAGAAAGAALAVEPALVMEPVRGRGFLYFNVLLFIAAIVSFLFTDIYSKDMVRGVLLPLLDAVFVIYFLFLFMMQRYRKRADSTARAEKLFRNDP